MYSFRFILTTVCCFISLIGLFFVFFTSRLHSEPIVFEEASDLKLPPNLEITGLPSSCKLPNLNPWNDEIMKFVNLDFRLESETSNSFIKTSLQNQTVSVQFPRYGHGSCSGRCILRKSEFQNSYGPWKDVKQKFDCDLVHVKCRFYLFYVFPYSYEEVHIQIVPVKRAVPLPEIKKYNIFVILIDATSHGQSHRNLPKTLHYLQERMEAVTFPYVNKVARNSRPNGFPLLLGKTLQGVGNLPPDLDDSTACQESMDGFKTILDDMREAGYRTLYSDDWDTNFFTHPNCTGFKRRIADHSITPLIREISVDNRKLRTKYRIHDMTSSENPKRVELLLDYFGKFIDSYKEEPKFGWIWTTDLSHDKQSTSICVDTMVYKMLLKHQNVLDDSFVFLMGDHGLTYGKEMQTKSGQLDVNNPMLTVSIPRQLRNSEVMQTLRNNAKQLITHFDTRATWLDIANLQNSGHSFNTSEVKIPGERGGSYLRKMSGDRNCQNLPIPAIYCICEHEKETLSLPLMHEISVQNPKLKMNYQIYDMNRREHPVRTKMLFDYFGSFVESYKEEPKFGWMWSIDMSHDKQSPSIGVDTMLYKFLVEHQEELDHSFLFLMADHGLTYGKEINTKTAKLELNNPMLTVSIPRELRNSGLKQTLINNARQLVTHYDTRATWLDIAKFKNDGLVMNSTKMKIGGEKGESLLRNLGMDRNCQNLPIPATYCICETEKETLPVNSTDALQIGRKLIASINNHVVINEPNAHRCGRWKLAEVISLQGVKPINKTGIYYISVRASEPYDKAIFSTMVAVQPTGDLTLGTIERKDPYGNRGECSIDERYCHCI